MNCKTDLCDTSYRLWYKANDLSQNEGQDIPLWSDESGFGENLTQSVQGDQPDLRTRRLVNFPTVQFDSVGDSLNVTTDVFNNKNKFILCFIVRQGNISSLREFMFFGTFPGDWSLGIGTNVGTLQVFIPKSLPNAGTQAATVAGFVTNTTDFVRVGIIYDGAAPTDTSKVRIFKNGVAQAVVVIGAPLAERLQLITDDTLRVGDEPNFPTTGSIEIPEIIVQTDKVNVNELLEIDAYLATKYFL